MASEGILSAIPGLKAAADLSAKQFHVVKITGDNLVNVAGAGEHGCGILQNDPKLVGEAATVAFAGVSKAKAAGVITAGAKVASDGAGAIVAAASGDHVIGVALEGAASGDVFSVLLQLGSVLA